MCALQYKNNLCASNPIPAMAQQCGSWETCMARDPTIVGRAKVGAELIAEVVNGFVEPISWKTLVRSSQTLRTIPGPDHYAAFIQGFHIDFSVFPDCFHQYTTFTLPFTTPSSSPRLITSSSTVVPHHADDRASFRWVPLPSAYS